MLQFTPHAIGRAQQMNGVLVAKYVERIIEPRLFDIAVGSEIFA